MQYLLSFIFMGIYSLFTPSVFAEVKSVESPTDALPSINYVGNGAAGDALGSLVSYGIGLTSILAVIAITWAGIMMFLSVGEEEKFKKAREILIYALVGVGVSGAAYVIVSLVSNLNFQ